MPWIQTDYWLKRRAKQFTVPLRQPHPLLAILRSADAKGPNDVHVKAITSMIEQERPKLAGLPLIAISLDLSVMEWRLLVTHGSLDEVPDGEQFPSERL